MRTSSLIVGTVVASGLAFAGGSERVVYTDGNLTGIATHSNAMLDVSQDKAMKLRVGRNDVSVLYSSVKAADAAADTITVSAPGKKAAKASQLVTIDFMSVKNEPRTMTLQMSKDASTHVLAAIHKHSTVVAPAVAPAPAATAKAEEKPVKPEKIAKADKPEKAAKADKNAKNTDKQDKQAKSDQKKADKQAKAEKKKEEKELAANEAAKSKSCAPDLPKGCSKNDWWGDSTWKTPRNLSKWEQQSSAPAAQ